jgi:crotonobetainyl-CoA:carnitine CoA-transferase CaiB-like acyl-CoA transferase
MYLERNGANVPTMEPYVLSTLRVLDLSEGIAGAYCTKLLVDAGAECVKVEIPHGDPLRTWSATGAPTGPLGSALFRFLHTSKKSVTADVQSPEDRRFILELASRADVVVTSALPGTLEALGLGYEDIAQRNPAVIDVSISPYGYGGPWSRRPANEFILQAECGSTGSRALPENPPLSTGGRVGEWIAGSFAAVATLALIRRARQTGQGEFVDVSILECMSVSFNVYESLHAQLSDDPDAFAAAFERTNELPAIEPTSDGWVGLTTVTGDQWKSFSTLMGRADLADDPGLANILTRWKRRTEVAGVITDWTRKHTADEILALAAENRIPAAPLGDGATIPTFDHVRERGIFVDHPGGDFVQPRPPYKITGVTARPFEPSPALGSTSPLESLEDWPPRAEQSETRAANATGPLAGLRVIDFSALWAGPLVGCIFAALGADVIRVESGSRPDPIRLAATTRTAPADNWWEYSWLYHGANAGKRGVAIDLRQESGLALAWQLIEGADVIVENFTPKVFDSFGVTADEISRRNPRAIYLRMPAFGLDGPWRERGGFTQTMEQLCGFAAVTGFVDGAPTMPRAPCDPLGGLHACFAALVALAQRERSGSGSLVEAPLIEAALNVAAEVVVELGATGLGVPRCGNRSPVLAPQGVYECADGQWLAISVESAAHWHALRTWLGSPEWAADPALDDVARRREIHDQIDVAVHHLVETMSATAARDELIAASVPVGVVITPPYIDRHEQLLARGFFEKLDHAVAGPLLYPGLPFKLTTKLDGWFARAAPAFAQHNHEVLVEELGCSTAQMAALLSTGAVSDRPGIAQA